MQAEPVKLPYVVRDPTFFSKGFVRNQIAYFDPAEAKKWPSSILEPIAAAVGEEVRKGLRDAVWATYHEAQGARHKQIIADAAEAFKEGIRKELRRQLGGRDAEQPVGMMHRDLSLMIFEACS
jgi:hypothetical protein